MEQGKAHRSKKDRKFPRRVEVTRSRPLKWLYIALGIISTGLGFLGIFVPLMPTTVFLLLAAWFFARSSERFYHWLLNNRLFGKYINAYLMGLGVPVKTKVWSVTLLWIAILSSAIFFTDNIYVRVLLILIAVGVTIHVVTLPTPSKKIAKKTENQMREEFSTVSPVEDEQ